MTTNDPKVYCINENVTKCYSDYSIYYDVTNMVNTNSGTLELELNTSKIQGSSFDGRIKLISLIVAYDDGDSDIFHYWINLGQDWSTTESSTSFNTENIGSNISDIILHNIALSSSDANYKINNKQLREENKTSGNYYQYNIWDIYWNTYTDIAQRLNTTLSFSATGGLYGNSFKDVLAVLIIKEGIPKEGFDVIVDSIKYDNKTSNYLGTPIAINITIKNIGNSKSQAIFVEITENGTFKYSFNVPQLETNETYLYHYLWTPSINGIINLAVTLDPNHSPDFNDLNVSNNNLGIDINILQKEATKILLTAPNILKGQKTEIKAILTDLNNNPLSEIIKLTINGISYTQKTDSNGIAFFKIANLNKGIYSVKVNFEGLNDFNSSESITTQTINEKTFLTLSVPIIYQGKTTNILASLKDSLGHPLLNRIIKIVLKGKNYYGTTNSKGIATFKIKGLKKGRYLVSANYEGLNNYLSAISSSYQNINVAPDLFISSIKRSGDRYYVTIKNIGYLKSANTKLKIYYKYGKKTKSKTVKLSSINAQKSLKIKVSFFKYNLHKRYKKIANILKNTKIKESDYNNNKKIFK